MDRSSLACGQELVAERGIRCADHHQRPRGAGARRRSRLAARLRARASGAPRHEEGMQPGRVRRLHGARRRGADPLLPGSGRPVRRARGDHDRGARATTARCIRCSRRSSTTTGSSAATARPGQICSAVGMARGGRARRAQPRHRRSRGHRDRARPRRAARADERQPVPLRRPQRDRRCDHRGLRGAAARDRARLRTRRRRRRRDPPRRA